MTLQEAFLQGKEKLLIQEIRDAELDAFYLLEFVTGITRGSYYVNLCKTIGEAQWKQYQFYIEQRAAHIPLQHITGVQEFMGMEFEVNSHVLIPRQDTETLVETVLPYLKTDMHILDMCTGSGCIVISLIKSTEADILGTAVDISTEALTVAGHNAAKHGVTLELLESDLFLRVKGCYEIIISNPPYIRSSVIEELQEEVRLYDPRLALDGKEDGLYFYRRIIADSIGHLTEDGHLFFEIGYDQAAPVTSLMQEAGFSQITVKKDLTGLDRVISGVYNKAKK